jgi:hypothetical protein
VPRLRWSVSAKKGRLGLVRDTLKVREGVRPAYWSAQRRLGKLCGAILEILDAQQGTATVGEIGLALGLKRPCDFARRHFPTLEAAGLIVCEGRGKKKVVTLCEGWLERLQEIRELCGEIESDRLARRSVERQREAYRNRNKVVPDHHPANRDADGWVEDLELLGADGEKLVEEEGPDVEVPVSPLARALASYLEKNPDDACRSPYWLSRTLWCRDLFPGKPAPGEVSRALEELGGDDYRRGLLRGDPAAA